MTFDLHLWPLTSWTCEGSYINKPNLVPIGLQLFKWGEFYILRPSYNLTSDFWPWYMTFDQTNIQRVLYCINKPSLVWMALQLFKWGHLHIFSLSYNLTSDILWPWYVTFDLINEGSNVASMTQLWLKSIKACKN